jgi:heme exporter protein A
MAFDGALFEARTINAWRGDRHILRDVSFTVRPGEFLKVTGPNGVGKTTLLRVICGLLPAETGSLEWRGLPIRGRRDEFNAEMSYLGHLNSLKADLTSREPQAPVGLRESLTAEVGDAALDPSAFFARRLPRVRSPQDRAPAGARQAGAGKRRALDTDEPVTNLDTAGIALVEELIHEHVSNGDSPSRPRTSDCSMTPPACAGWNSSMTHTDHQGGPPGSSSA